MGRYSRTDDSGVVAATALGDLDALAELLTVRYRDTMEAIVRRHYPDADSDFTRDLLADFYSFLAVPNTRGEMRLRNISGQRQPKAYVARALENFLNDSHERDVRDPVVCVDLDEGRVVEIGDADADEALADKRRREAEVRVLLQVLESCRGFSARDRYILTTYLVGKRYVGEGSPLQLQQKLAKQLGIPAGTVYNAYDRALKRLRAMAREQLERQL